LRKFAMLLMIMFVVCNGETEAAAGLMEESSTFRCNRGLVSISDTWYEVKEKCGEPTSFSSGEWVYDFGRNSFIYVLKFRNSKVYKIINTGNYGLR